MELKFDPTFRVNFLIDSQYRVNDSFFLSVFSATGIIKREYRYGFQNILSLIILIPDPHYYYIIQKTFHEELLSYPAYVGHMQSIYPLERVIPVLLNGYYDNTFRSP